MPQAKRILSIKFVRETDTDPDTSYLGEYGNRAESKYSIDREHARDCAINTHNIPLDRKTRTMANVAGNCECVDQGCPAHEDRDCSKPANTILYRVDIEDVSGTLMCDDCANDATESGLFVCADDSEMTESECTCDEHGDRLAHDEFQYFNPNWENYKGLPETDIRKYCLQDYARMEDYNQGWCYLLIGTNAEISVDGHIQRITSGYVGGVESDSGESYLKEMEQEQLSELRGQLSALGFSKRAIAQAVKSSRLDK